MNPYLSLIIIFFYYIGCKAAWTLMSDKRMNPDPLTLVDKIIKVVLTPLSWITYVGLYLIVLGATMRNDFYN